MTRMTFKDFRQQRTIATETLLDPVHVPQGEAAMIETRLIAQGFRYIATCGLGPCVGVLVIGASGVGLTHIDSDSEKLAPDLARYALATIQDTKQIIITSGTTLPQPGGGGDRSATNIYTGLMTVFPKDMVTVLNSSEIAYDLVGGKHLVKITYKVDARKPRRDGVPYWSVKCVPPLLLQE